MATKNQTKATHAEHGKQGFASMSKERVKEIAKKGGKSSHSGSRSSQTEKGGKSSHGKQGFASMIKDKVKEIANKGGSSRGSNR
ncbi:MAG: hypothetical protein BGO77_08120 [Caedibacter sp. 37-49]|nr:MAG: hypothetical protein BGO77_08120 [Caedibacter sp. 37-49]